MEVPLSESITAVQGFSGLWSLYSTQLDIVSKELFATLKIASQSFECWEHDAPNWEDNYLAVS